MLKNYTITYILQLHGLHKYVWQYYKHCNYHCETDDGGKNQCLIISLANCNSNYQDFIATTVCVKYAGRHGAACSIAGAFYMRCEVAIATYCV